MDSWWLKFDRAEQHLKEIQAEIATMMDVATYGAVRSPHQSQEHRHIWRYVLRFNEYPDPMFSTVLGDFIHNIRSGLDHLAVGLVPSARKTHTFFPVQIRDIWKRDAKRRYLVRDPESRRSFRAAIKGMRPEAVTVIKALQPCNQGDRAHLHGLSLINRLENADKHRGLTTVYSTLQNPVAHLWVRGVHTDTYNWHGAADDGTEIVRLDTRKHPGLAESEVDVQVHGSVVVAIRILEEKRYVPVSDLGGALEYARYIGYHLAPFTRKGGGHSRSPRQPSKLADSTEKG